MEDTVAFVSNLFLEIDIGQIAQEAMKLQQVFALLSGFDMKMIDLQNDMKLKGRAVGAREQTEFFSFLTTCPLRVTAFFGLQHLCKIESLQS